MKRWIVMVATLAVAGGAARADIINVPGDYLTIQAAINAAQPGDDVAVAPGVYDPINYFGKAVTVRSTSGPEVTTIDATGFSAYTAIFPDDGPPLAVLEGFTLTGSPIRCVNVNGSTCAIRDCIITGNQVGLEIEDGGNATITNCTITGQVGLSGGNAAWIHGASTALFVECVLNDNTAIGMGGAVRVTGAGSRAILVNTTLQNNTAERGGAVSVEDNGHLTIANCLVAGNTATLAGGAIHCESLGVSMQIINSTLVANSAVLGGAMFNDQFSTPIVSNSIIWGNSPDQVFDATALTMARFSTVEGGWPGQGNIDADPLFVDPTNGNFRLSPSSPCIDAGHNWAIAALADTDLDGNPRFADDPTTPDTGCGIPVIVDMGAFEFHGDPFAVKFGDIDGSGTVGTADLLGLLAAWGPAPGCDLADLDLDGTVGTSDLLILLGEWG